MLTLLRSFFLASLLCICATTTQAQLDFVQHEIINNRNVTDGANAIFAADIDGDGDLDMLSASLENFVVGWFENLDGTYSDQHVISNDLEGARAVYAADMDGDGDLDVISSSFNNDVKLVWYENLDGLGNFGTEKLISTGPFGVQDILSMDLDDDGDNDVVVGTFFDNTVSWFENLDGLGNFGIERFISENTTFLKDIHASDADGDGDIDVFSSFGVNSANIVWYKNNGFGNFTNAGAVTSEVVTPEEVFTADIDGDGDLDVIATHSSNSVNDRLAWYENEDGLGDWGQENVIFASAENVVSVYAADMDGDNDMDLIAASVFDYKIAWYENLDGQGSFGGENLITTEIFGTPTIKVADLDNDGDMDVYSASDGDDKVAWYENIDGLGNFGEQIILSINVQRPAFTVAGDLDDDGDLDVISASADDNEISWFENLNGQIDFARQQIISKNALNATSVFVADLNGDAALDVISSSRDDGKIAWYRNVDGKGKFAEEQIVVLDDGSIYLVEAHDMDGDGDLDIVYSNRSDMQVVWMENDGAGNFSNKKIIASSVNFANNFETADFDKDGDLDVAYAAQSDDLIAWHENTDGLGNFGAQQIIVSAFNNANGLSAADIDNDGDLDLFASSYEDEQVVWFENLDGQGDFSDQKVVFQLADSYAFYAVAADMDGDLDMDVLSISGEYNQIVWYENLDGLGTFGVPQIVSSSPRTPTMISIADIDNDGNIDVLTPIRLDDRILWYENGSANGNDLNGIIRFDSEGDGCNEMDEAFANVKVRATQNGMELSTFSSQNGVYQLFPGSGDYSAMLELPDYFVVEPAVYSSTFSALGITNAVDFCVKKEDDYVDVGISLFPIGDARPGFEANYTLAFHNIGTAKMDGTIELEFDADRLEFLSASSPLADQTTNTLLFNYSDLDILGTDKIELTFKVFAPPIVNIDEKLGFTAVINPMDTDGNLADNTFTLEQTVIGSFDPNDILVLEGESILLEDANDFLHYIIRFQNTGTADAINVKVTNRLDTKLDGNTFELEATSHASQVMIVNDRDFSFTFNNIHLPDSTSDEEGSHGYIAYKIKPNSDIALGDIISNQAEIFFDFNPPIITNIVMTEIVEVDIQAPTMLCQNVSAELGPDGTVVIAPSAVDNGSSDNVGIATFSLSPNTFTCADIGTSEITLTGTDEQGNSESCTSVVTILDALAPSADLPVLPELTAECELANISPPTAMDNCSDEVMVTSNINLPITEQGTTIVTWTYTDVNGNSSTQTQTVVLQDVTYPTAIVQDVTVDLKGEPSVTITPEQVDNGSFDNCGIGFFELNVDTFTETGEYNVLFRVVDVNNLDVMASSTITVTDSTVNVVDHDFNETVQVFPNPTTNLITVNVGDEAVKEILIYSSLGELLKVEEEHSIDLSEFSSGVYGLYILTETNRVAFKRVVKL